MATKKHEATRAPTEACVALISARTIPATAAGILCLFAAIAFGRSEAIRTRRIVLGIVAIAIGSHGLAADEGIIALDPFTVKADRFEDFGFDITGPGKPSAKTGDPIWTIHFVIPNTAAAKAGLKPGDRLLKMEGHTVGFRRWSEWTRLRRQKTAEAATGNETTWTLEILPAGQRESIIATLVLPTPPPHWGSSIWQAPLGRAPITEIESGPLAERAREVLNSGIWRMEGWEFPKKPTPEFTANNGSPLLGFHWTIVDQRGRSHRMFVSQQRGRTDVIVSEGGPREKIDYLTSPTGILEQVAVWPRKKSKPGTIPAEHAAGFQREVDFWLNKVGKVTPRWPLELIPVNGADTK